MNQQLSSRDRVLMALKHEETDRVPVDFLATEEFWVILGRHLGLHSREAIYQKLGVDLRHPRTRYIGPPLPKAQGEAFLDHWGIQWVSQSYDGGVYNEAIGSLLREIKDASELKNYPWPKPEWFDVDYLAQQVAWWDEQAEYAIALDEFGDPGGPFEIAGYLLGFENLLTNMILNPDLVYELLTHITNFFLGLLERVLSRLGDRIDLIWTSDDIAHQRGMLISLPMWEKLIRPHHERLNHRVHEFGCKVMYHSCGSVIPAIPGLIQAGIDVLDVLQWSAEGMLPEKLKQDFGDRLSFHGGLDVQGSLPKLSMEDMRQEASHIIQVMGRNGGFILSPSHNVQIDTPPTNLIVAYETAGSIYL